MRLSQLFLFGLFAVTVGLLGGRPSAAQDAPTGPVVRLDSTSTLNDSDATPDGGVYFRQYGPFDVSSGTRYEFTADGPGGLVTGFGLEVYDAATGQLLDYEWARPAADGDAAPVNRAAIVWTKHPDCRVNIRVRNDSKEWFRVRVVDHAGRPTTTTPDDGF